MRSTARREVASRFLSLVEQRWLQSALDCESSARHPHGLHGGRRHCPEIALATCPLAREFDQEVLQNSQLPAAHCFADLLRRRFKLEALRPLANLGILPATNLPGLVARCRSQAQVRELDREVMC